MSKAGSAKLSKDITTAVAARDAARLRAALGKPAAKIPAAAMVKAAQLAWLPGLKLLAAKGGDLNASYKNYRPLHTLIQEEPHGVTDATPERVRCMQWMLAHGADPEQAAAWPSARALVIAAFQGQRDYVDVLKKAGGPLDIFTAAALGDAPRVERMLAADKSRALARDHDRLTALQCS